MLLSAPQTYYQYGSPTRSIDSKVNSYLYGEKEFEQRQGLNTYDFLARTYAPDEARFWQPDPEATTYHGISPYTFCAGDPINYVDRDGRYINLVVAAVIGAGIDIGTQLASFLIMGKPFNEALYSIDWTSVIASAATSMLLTPCARSGVKAASIGINVADAAIDMNCNGIKYVGATDPSYEKPINEVVIDLGVGALPDFGVKHTSINTSTSIKSSVIEVEGRNWTKEELDNTTKVLFKVSGIGLKESRKNNDLRLPKNTEPTDAIRSNNPPPILSKFPYEKFH